MSGQSLDKWNKSAQLIIDDTVQLVEDLLSAEEVRPIEDLRRDASALLRRHEFFMGEFHKAFGKDTACPTVRAWYLLDLALQHATLLGEP